MESIVPALAENTTYIDLKPGKPTGPSMTQLGVPVLETTVVKKGKLHELIQLMADGQVGRRFQNFRITGVKTSEGGVEAAKLFLQFEIFGDDNVPEGESAGFGAALYAGDEKLVGFGPFPAFLPYARAWYENQFVFEVPLELFARVDRLEFTAKPDQVRMI